MTRIIGGAAAAARLEVVASGTRPTSEKVREALFSTLSAAFEFAGARVVDLYAGSGALGLEALSRGAEEVTLVERSARAVAVLRRNVAAVLDRLDGAGSARVEQAVVRRWLEAAAAKSVVPEVDLAFVDPPYDLETAAVAEDLRQLHPLLSADALVVVERSTRATPLDPPAEYALWREKTYGETSLRYFEVAPLPAGTS